MGVTPVLTSPSCFTLNWIFLEMPDDIFSPPVLHVSSGLLASALEPSEEGAFAHAAQKPVIIPMPRCRQYHFLLLQQIVTWNKNSCRKQLCKPLFEEILQPEPQHKDMPCEILKAHI